MAKKPEEVLKDMRGNNYAPLYFMHGDEPFYIDQLADYVEENALKESEKGFNLTVVYGKDVKLVQVVDSARRFPMMAQRQVVVVKEAQEIQDFGKKDAQAHLVDYAKNPVPSTILVFCYKHKKLDGRSELSKVLGKHAVVVETKKLYENQLAGWVTQHCKDIGHGITDKAALMLAEFIGNDLNRIANEVEKLLVNYNSTVEINEDMVIKHVGISKEYNVFELQSALALKKVFKVNQIIKYFQSNPKDNPVIPVVSMLYSYFSKILLLHHNRTMERDQLARLLKVNPYFLKEYQQAAQNYPLSKTMNIIHFLHKADLQTKGVDSVTDSHEVLKELTFKILHT
ncbi:DNA polymerase III subunit delta [Flammeovirgaceae bacterium SG7u.111]|nr:DNA polymerase III subunit delta [Flammeovirgaceae bacterium SG7u.132]WPO34456.1 DNA polymerase III subunit delta [Flammeovirgaceae bacterium SG7u.111]